MFVGDYCQENIGHEIINVYQADNGKFYVYLNSTGDFAYDKKGQVEFVVLTRNCPIPNAVQVIGKAKVRRELFNPDKVVDQKKEDEIKSIKYGGASIVNLFNANTHDQNIYVTYEVEEIIEPREDLFISFDSQSSVTGKKIIYLNKSGSQSDAIKMARASLKQYVDKKDYPFAFKALEEAINNESYWKREPVSKVPANASATQQKDNFFKICKIENDELVYSNAFAYLAKRYRMEFCEFAKEVLKVSLSEDFEIHREKWNIDILVADDKNVIVLENKVLSHINGLWFDRNANQEQSQLKKYYDIVRGNDNRFNPEKEYADLSAHFFVVAPNHNDIDLNQYTCGEKYQMITYSQVYDFIKKRLRNDAFVEQLLLAMEPHCEPTYDFYSEMKNSFLQQCEKSKKIINPQ